MNTIRRSALALSIAAATVLGLAACAPDEAEPASSSAEVVAPTMADFSSLEGQTIELPQGGTLVITGDDETFDKWTAEQTDDMVAKFVAGSDDGSAQYNPGFEALAAGETKVTLVNSETGASVTFTIVVK